MTIPIDSVQVSAFVLALTRAIAWLILTPPFNTRLVPIQVKGGFAAALALAATNQVADQHVPFGNAEFIAAVIAQVVTGVSMGMLVSLLFHAVQTAGSLVDLVAGFSLASVYDPMSEAQTSVFGRTYQLVGITLLFVTNSHLIIVSGFLRSFEVVPVGGFSVAQVSGLLTRHLGALFVAALEIAGPILACLFLTEFALGLVSRAAPSLNVFSLAFPVRVGVTLIVTAIALPLLVPAISNLVNSGVRISLGGG
jgi:flagellar biosynthetic protein FliR